MTVLGCLVGILRGDELPPEVWAEINPGAVVDAAKRHGVLPLVADRLCGSHGVPAPLLESLQREARRQAATDLDREDELRRLLDACTRAGVDALVFKGAELAYQVYPRPDLRVRVDSDLLIAPERRRAMHDVLVALDYQPLRQVEGRHVIHQRTYVRRRNGASGHEVDVHWRLANPEAFGDLPSFDELWRRAEPLPALTPGATGLSVTDALLVACVHRVAHHFDSNALVWFYDIHLLARTLRPDQWTAFVEAAGRARVASTSRHSLKRTVEWLKTPVPQDVLAELQRLAIRGREPSAEYLSPGRRPIQDVVSDLRALPTWSARSRLMSEHLFPSGLYMREVYGSNSRAPLPALYLWRALRGARKWLRRR